MTGPEQRLGIYTKKAAQEQSGPWRPAVTPWGRLRSTRVVDAGSNAQGDFVGRECRAEGRSRSLQGSDITALRPILVSLPSCQPAKNVTQETTALRWLLAHNAKGWGDGTDQDRISVASTELRRSDSRTDPGSVATFPSFPLLFPKFPHISAMVCPQKAKFEGFERSFPVR
jgi:hypothetical protein